MSRIAFPLMLLMMVSRVLAAADLANGERINLSCAPCHATYGQGVPGETSPRLAGLPDWYLAKATQDYKKGARKNPLMVQVSGLGQLSDADIADVSAYLAGLDIVNDPAYNILLSGANADEGKDAKPHLMTVNMEMVIDNQLLPAAAQRIAILINQDMLAIMAAGAKGG